jgi:hypothetical protein
MQILQKARQEQLLQQSKPELIFLAFMTKIKKKDCHLYIHRQQLNWNTQNVL